MMERPIRFCGDTFLRTRDGEDPFAETCCMIRGSSVCLNLETALNGGRQKEKNVSLSVSETALSWLPKEVQVVTIVNNHTADSGNPGSLARELAKRGKTVVGPANPATTRATIEGVTVDFLSAYFSLPRLHVSYNGSKAAALERMLSESVAQRKIVNLHWGYEHTNVPAPFQRELAHRLIDAGADIIIGHHPHVPQGWEVYKGKSVFYSLGNFNFWQFDAETTERNRWGYMVDYDLASGKTEPILYRINDNYQPYRVTGADEADLLRILSKLSESVRVIDTGTWFKTEYAEWYAREIAVWKRRCLEKRSPQLYVKWIAWMCMPMQWKYRACVARHKTSAILRNG